MTREVYYLTPQSSSSPCSRSCRPTHSAATSCRVYSYYVGASASSCSETPSNWPTGTNDNGNVAGYLFQDSMNALGHTATYTYDGVNRLSTAAATGSVAYNQTYTYTGDGSTGQYGNLNCSPSGPGCVALTYNTASNRVTSSGYAYDAAGNLTGDGTNTYQWDAEAHLTKAVNGAGVAISTNTYNALGQRVRDVTQTTATDEAYGAGGELLWRYTSGDSNTCASATERLGTPGSTVDRRFHRCCAPFPAFPGGARRGLALRCCVLPFRRGR